MANEATRRVAQLPGFDTAPDVYETPDLDDSTTSGTLQTWPRGGSSASETSSEEADRDDDEDDDDDDDGGGFGISRRRLYPQRARSRFGAQARGVETAGTDLSDRVDGKRRGYTITRRRLGGEGEVEEEEGLEARIARLRREVEECRVMAREERERGEREGEGEGEGEEDVDGLSKLLAGIDVPSSTGGTISMGHRRGASEVGQIFHDALPTAPRDTSGEEDEVDEHTLSRITAFDTRLAALESTLGISAVLDPSSAADILSTPLLPSLTLLDQQLSTLTSASSLANLEAASTRIAKLKLEAQTLSTLHRPATSTATSEMHSEEEEGEEEETETAEARPAHLTPDDAKKLEGLYTLLPTAQSLAPTVPALITRLRSLRTLHTTAATAAGDLDAIEQRQTELDRELKMWREGLERVERAVKEADTANGRNGNFVKTWVEDLEARMKALGR